MRFCVGCKYEVGRQHGFGGVNCANPSVQYDTEGRIVTSVRTFRGEVAGETPVWCPLPLETLAGVLGVTK